MRTRLYLFCAAVALWLLALAPRAGAEEIVLGLSADEVAITVTFDGSDLLIFGAVRRDEPPPEGAPLEVIVTVAGPDTPVKVRRMSRVMGIFMNTSQAEIDSAPSFYAVATTGPLKEILSATEDLRHGVSIPRAIRSVGNDVADTQNFTQALIRIRSGEDNYRLLEGKVDLEKETLFRTAIALPANLIEGNYQVRIFLTRDRKVVDRYDAMIGVQKVGIERWLFNLSREHPMLYGLLSLAFAIAAGWGASTGFRLLRR